MYLPFSAFVSAPFVLLRWTASDGAPRYVHTVEFAIYIVQTGGILAAYSSALVSGKKPYHVMEHVRNYFSADGRFQKIESSDDVYDWLETVLEKVYNNSNPSGKLAGRVVAGRLSLLHFFRLRQNRVKSSDCPQTVYNMGAAGFEKCYLSFDRSREDRSQYSSMNFTWTNMPYKTYSGTVDMNDETVPGDFTSYPIAGYWTLFANDCTYELAIGQLRAMKEAGWIDTQTRLIAWDFGFLVPDASPLLWGTADFKIEVTPEGQFVPFGQTMTLNVLPLIVFPTPPENFDFGAMMNERIAANQDTPKPVDTGNSDPLNRCLVLEGGIYFIPFYLGMFSTAIYTVFIHTISLIRNWKAHLMRPFSYTELLWVLFLFASAVLRLSGDAKNPCMGSLILQEPFVNATTPDDIFRSSLTWRYEMLSMGQTWQDSRHLLAMALFLHFFNFFEVPRPLR